MRKSTWECPVQQRPTSWKAWKKSITEFFAQDGSMMQPLGAWYVGHHSKQEWYLDARAQELWHQTNNKWIRHQAQNIGPLRFVIQGREGADILRHALMHVAIVTQRQRYIEINEQTPIHTQYIKETTQLVPYVSAIGEAFHALPRHMQRLVGGIGEFQTPRQWDVIKEVDLIIATDGSVLFGLGYHSWIIATESEYILLAGGGLDDGPGKYMTSYRSELGGIITGLAVLGTLVRSGLINARRIKFICDYSAAILASKREVTQSIFRRSEGDHDLIATMKYLQHNWCTNTEVTYAWVKCHADRGDQEPNREERLDIEAGALCDLIREDAKGPRGTRPSCPNWDLEVCSLFIRGDKITSKMKLQVEGQLHDKDMRKYII
jgi:hypothetical protein